MKINIPEILIHLRNKIVEDGGAPLAERVGMKVASFALSGPRRLGVAQDLGRLAQRPFQLDGTITSLPGTVERLDGGSRPESDSKAIVSRVVGRAQ